MAYASFQEKRAAQRFPANLPVDYCEVNSGTAVSARTHDLSARGLCLITEHALSPGTLLDIFLTSKNNQNKIYRQGRVIWSSIFNGEHRCGILLQEPPINPIPIVLENLLSSRSRN